MEEKMDYIDIDELQNQYEYVDKCIDEIRKSMELLEEHEQELIAERKRIQRNIAVYFERRDRDLAADYERYSI